MYSLENDSLKFSKVSRAFFPQCLKFIELDIYLANLNLNQMYYADLGKTIHKSFKYTWTSNIIRYFEISQTIFSFLKI